jgi:chromate transporter
MLQDSRSSKTAGRPLEVLAAATRLGLTSFGGPIAHLGYFRDEYVVRRKWVDEQTYADLVALCQFLPGPASSQVGIALGIFRAGLLGGLAAWLGFTLPSAIAMVLFAYGAGGLRGAVGDGLLHGLKIVAVAVVAQAVWSMARALAPDPTRASIAVAATLVVTFAASAVGQIAAIVLGAAAGLRLCRGTRTASEPHPPLAIPRALAMLALATFVALLVLLPVAARLTGSQAVALVEAFYRAGALVFGGGHVVLPLLQASVVRPGWVGPDTFLAGYGAAQAVPGPLFTFAAYLGAVMEQPPNGVGGATICLVAIFLPGLLLVVGVLPFWGSLRRRSLVQAAMRGVNAAVVGILLAALYHPVWTSAIHQPRDFALALIGFLLLAVWSVPPWIVVAVSAAVAAVLATV